MIEVPAWRTSDGWETTDKLAALEHQDKLNVDLPKPFNPRRITRFVADDSEEALRFVEEERSGMKLCKVCREKKPESEFRAQSRGVPGVRTECKKCEAKNYSVDNRGRTTDIFSDCYVSNLVLRFIDPDLKKRLGIRNRDIDQDLKDLYEEILNAKRELGLTAARDAAAKLKRNSRTARRGHG